jgi:ankyrin repeat protein
MINNMQIQDILKQIVTDFGKQIFDKNKSAQLGGILSDYMADDKVLQKLFRLAVADGIAHELLQCDSLDKPAATIKINTLKIKFKDDNFLEEDRAYFVVDCFVYALGLATNIQNVNLPVDNIQPEKTIETIKVIDPTVNEKDKHGKTKLHNAVYYSHVIEVKELIQLGADVNMVSGGNEPLYWAIYNRNLDIAELLINAGADINKEFLQNGESPLEYAIRQKTPSIVELLIRRGADINKFDIYGKPLINKAIKENATDIVKILIEGGFNVNKKEDGGDNNTPLIIASEEGRKEIVELLLKSGADINGINKKRETALICAACKGRYETSKILINGNVNINAADADRDTALICAAQEGYDEIVEMLIKAGADLNRKNKKGLTAIAQASSHGYTEIVEVLIKAGADVNTGDNSGVTPIRMASVNNYDDIVELLAEAGADRNDIKK